MPSPNPTPRPAFRRVLLVGHCGFDAMGLTRAVKRALPGASVSSADRPDELDAAGPDDLLLINRKLPASTGHAAGVELIRALQDRDADRRPAAVLVSDLPDAQREAEDAGAWPGFGKAELRAPATRDRLVAAASLDPRSPDASPGPAR